ncbi:MAG: IS200/IS605 family transposase [Bacteroidetes bacterium]|nr:IS200/IS605 family transposase [Bacteroidota bacterium]
MSYTQILYQIVFSTKGRVPCLIKSNRDTLFKYITGIIQQKNCFLYIINGVEDHIHILMDLHPGVCLADIVKEIKVSSSLFIKENNLFPQFKGWNTGYGAFTYSIREKKILINYILNQESHHHKTSSTEEMVCLLKEHEVDFKVEYLP